ncbi:DUF6090 family protein [Yeosuana marina]|uniref:DUF6090 family protein n=1 Tax=Yeosuana marina TaxID=1565536 RepID=UPI0030C80062
MIKLFRNIRKKLVAEGKTTNYLKYAIGEIFLVVIGILIALQVNNWNERRKQNIQKDLIVQSLIRDLKMDTLMIDQTLNILKQDTTQVFGFIKQMSNDHVTIDTLINIARFKFDPKVHVAVSFNNNTLKSLLSTGNLNILDKWLQDEILQLDVMHEDNISRTQLNLRTYVDQVISFERKYPLGDYGNISPHSKLAEAIWEKAQFEELGTYLNGLLAIRNVTNIYAIGQLNGIQEKTKEILLQFSDKQSKQ